MEGRLHSTQGMRLFIAIHITPTGETVKIEVEMEYKPKYEMIPSKELSLELLKVHKVPEHIVRHSLQVHKVALYLSKLLNEKGESLNIEAIEAAAILHDITKMDGFRTGKNHALTGAALLRSLGHGLIGDIVAYHITLPEEDPIRITEYELINYSDKRVMHYRIVTLQERFQDILKRYGRNERSRHMMEVWKEKALRLERKIFSKLNISPEVLLDL